MLRHANVMMNRMVVGGFCAIALAATACAGGSDGSRVSLTSPSVAAVPTSRVTAAAAVDGPLKALKKAVANCGGTVVDALQIVFAGAGQSPITSFSDSGTSPHGDGTLTFTFGSTTFTITYTDSNGDGHLSCGDTVTDANP